MEFVAFKNVNAEPKITIFCLHSKGEGISPTPISVMHPVLRNKVDYDHV
jgi:hypothetical protein